MTAKRQASGFTLLEIMLVVTIIALLLGMAIYKTIGHLEFARDTRVTADIRALKISLSEYEAQNGFYPTTEQGLRALVQQPDTDPKPARWRRFAEEVPRDPWQSEYVYRCPGIRHPDRYDLFSAGKDRKPDTDDDDWGQ